MANDNEARVFLSYARADAGFMEALAAYLQAGGLRTWFDLEDLPEGEAWENAVERALAEATHYVACLSAHSAASQSIAFELARATRLGMDVLPVRIGGAADAIPATVTGRAVIDVSGLPWEEAAFAASREITRLIAPTPVSVDVSYVARAIHERWRASMRAAGEPTRWRRLETSDLAWLQARADLASAVRSAAPKGAEVDLLRLRFRDLPPSVSGEAMRSAQDATRLVQDEAHLGLEALAGRVHEQWIARNRDTAPATLLQPYAALPEAEKEKDRIIVRTAALAARRDLR